MEVLTIQIHFSTRDGAPEPLEAQDVQSCLDFKAVVKLLLGTSGGLWTFPIVRGACKSACSFLDILICLAYSITTPQNHISQYRSPEGIPDARMSGGCES